MDPDQLTAKNMILATRWFAELIESLEIRIFGPPPGELPLDDAKIEDLNWTIEQCIRGLPHTKDFEHLAVTGSTHEEFLVHWRKLENILDEFPSADDDDWREMTKTWWEENRVGFKEVLEAIRDAKIILPDQ